MRRFACLAFPLICLAPLPAISDTIFYFTGTPSSWVSGGRTETITPTSGFGWDFSIWRSAGHSFSIDVNDFDTNPDFYASTWWTVDFAAPFNEPLAPGIYRDAKRYPFQARSEPGLSFSGDGRGNNRLVGYFNVLEIDYGGDRVPDSFAIDFLQYGEYNLNAFDWGSIRYNSDVPVTEEPVELDPPPVPLPAGFALLLTGLLGFLPCLRGSRARHCKA